MARPFGDFLREAHQGVEKIVNRQSKNVVFFCGVGEDPFEIETDKVSLWVFLGTLKRKRRVCCRNIPIRRCRSSNSMCYLPFWKPLSFYV